ncbi:DUF397 domain-containing protein [Nocardiopsis halophila]|uniref:DUF397 domain-containing protein n=1 Tax=Nocardiopsis halophila TaxID=141692 RepID=UPI0009FD0919
MGPVHWYKSSRSGANADCVELAEKRREVLVRDTKNRAPRAPGLRQPGVVGLPEIPPMRALPGLTGLRCRGWCCVRCPIVISADGTRGGVPASHAGYPIHE